MKKNKIVISLLIVVWLVTLGIIALKYTTKLTYIEYQYENENSTNYLTMINSEEYLEQSFKSPYDILYGIAIKVGTFKRDNNSLWNISLLDKSTKELIYQKDYNASLIDDNSFHLFKFDRNISVKKGHEYIIRITPVCATTNTSIAYYIGEELNLSGAIFNDTELTESLCFSVYGGDFDAWWTIYAIAIAICISFTILRATFIYKKGNNPINDKIVGSMVVFFIVILLLNSFSVYGVFIDEGDNIRGGMIIANGGVLYRDYITQHTPIMYYLCGIFAFFGASSVQQFRLSYYLLEGIIWGILYARHMSFFGKKKMMLLPVLECFFITSFLLGTGEIQGYMILSDTLQGLCIVALLLEFLRYYKERTITWGRSIVISLASWTSFGVAFMSVYSIFFVVIAVIALEVAQNIKEGKTTISLLKKYYKLIICLTIPLIITLIYFCANHSLKCAFDQFYRFNREVYPNYTSLGDNIFKPFIDSVGNFFGVVADNFINIIGAKVSYSSILHFVTATTATSVTIKMLMKKKYIESFVLFAVMISSAARGYGFHGAAAWYVAIMIIVIFGYEIINTLSQKVTLPISITLIIILISLYIKSIGNNLLFEQKPISEIESRIVAMTDSNEKILIDANTCDSIYLCYKGRFPVNKVCYMLPWYMDWYEQDTIDDLNNNYPKIAVYNPDQQVWGYQYYSNAFYNDLKSKYTQYSNNPDDKLYKLWIRNE